MRSLLLALCALSATPSLAASVARPLPPPAASVAEDLTYLVSPKNLIAKEGDELVTIFARGETEGVTFGATGLPPGLRIDEATGAVSGLLPKTAGGDYTVKVTAKKGTHSEWIRFTWTVLDVTAARFEDPGVQLLKSGDEVSLQLLAIDDGGDVLTYKAYGLPPGLTLDAKTGLISGKLKESDIRTTYYTTITATDGSTMGGLVITFIVLASD